MKARGGRRSALIAFECLGTLMKHDAGVLLKFLIRASGIQENGNIHKLNIELYCYGDLSFQNECHQCYHNAVDDYRIKL